MKPLLYTLLVLLLLPCAVAGTDGFSLTVTNTRVAHQRRYVTIDVRVRDDVSLTSENTLLVVVGSAKAGGPADEYGPPQNFALKGTNFEVGPHRFRVEVALPLEKVRVKFMLVDKKKVFYEQSRQL